MPTLQEQMSKVQDKTIDHLQILWKKRMHGLTGVYQDRLRSKEVGILNKIRKAFGDQHMKCVEYALQNWHVFTWKVKEVEGLSTAPSQPHARFLLAHYKIVAQLIVKAQSVKPMVENKSVATTYVMEQHVEELAVLTPEQLQQIEDAKAWLAAKDE